MSFVDFPSNRLKIEHASNIIITIIISNVIAIHRYMHADAFAELCSLWVVKIDRHVSLMKWQTVSHRIRCKSFQIFTRKNAVKQNGLALFGHDFIALIRFCLALIAIKIRLILKAAFYSPVGCRIICESHLKRTRAAVALVKRSFFVRRREYGHRHMHIKCKLMLEIMKNV